MNIVYLGRHDQINCHDDEGAITDSLNALGHKVTCIHENDHTQCYDLSKQDYDIILINTFGRKNISLLQQLINNTSIPIISWFFDLCSFPATSSIPILHNNKEYALFVSDNLCACFFTDGDFVNQHSNTRPVFKLSQGSDQAYYGFWPINLETPLYDMCFIGTMYDERKLFIEKLQQKLDFTINIFDKYNLFYENLYNIVSLSKIVLCPNFPVTDRYWSNRVYVFGNMGCNILHPESIGVFDEYASSICYYNDNNIVDIIHDMIDDREGRRRRQFASQQLTQSRYTYKHRCNELIRKVSQII